VTVGVLVEVAVGVLVEVGVGVLAAPLAWNTVTKASKPLFSAL
jgi:hypothetical protein